MPRIIDEQKKDTLELSMKNMDATERYLWNAPSWEPLKYDNNKTKIIIEYICLGYDDNEREEFVNYINNDTNGKRVFDKLIDYPYTANLIIDNIDIIRDTFIGKDKKKLEELNSLCEKHLDGIKFNHTDESQNEQILGIEALAYRKEQKRVKSYKDNLESIKKKIYDPRLMAYMASNFELQEANNDEYRACAAIIHNKSVDVWDYNYSYQKCMKEAAQIDKKIQKLSKDRDFRAFVDEILTKDASCFEKEKFTKEFEKYKNELKKAREAMTYDDTLMFGFDDRVVSSSEKEDLRAMGKSDEYIKDYILTEMEEYESVASITIQNLKNTAGSKIKEIEDKGGVFRQADCKDACDYVIAKIFKGPLLDKTLLSKKYMGKKLNPDVGELNREVFRMRKELMADPVFQNVLAMHVGKSSFYDAYRKELNREINKKINEEKKIRKTYKNDREKYNAHVHYMRTHTVDLKPETSKFIDDIRSELERINGNKKPSEYMKKLMDALDDIVLDDAQGGITVEKMDRLNRAALSYYSERQGMIFSPLTDKGKARLADVERLCRVTDKIMKQQRKLENADRMKRQSMKSI